MAFFKKLDHMFGILIQKLRDGTNSNAMNECKFGETRKWMK